MCKHFYRVAAPVLVLVWAAAAAAAEPMVFPGRDWEQASPESQGVDRVRLRAAVDYLQANSGSDGVDQLVIIRNGRMIWQGPKIDKMHGVWSATKSFTSTVLGLLIDDGKCSLQTPAADHLPAMAAAYPNVTLAHFTTMTSGYRAVGDEPRRGGYAHGPSITPFVPNDSPLFTPPGSKFAYWDSAMNQFANVLTRIAGEPIEELFGRRIADPIGMNREKWDWGDFGEIDGVVVNGGSGNNNKHIRISAREIARLGLLFLNQGRWNGEPLLGASWVARATWLHVPASLPLGHLESGIDGRGVYGCNWWVNGLKPDGKRKWPGVPKGTYSASGYNNNDMFVIPEWSMVVVRLGLDQGSDGPISDATYATFLQKIGEAITDTSPPAGVPVLGFRKEPHPDHEFLTYVWARFPEVPGFTCDAWCYESAVDFLDFSKLADGTAELRHRLRGQPHVIFVTTVTPEPGAVEFVARAVVDRQQNADGRLPDDLPGLNLCFQLRRAEGFASKPDPYPEFVRRCFLFTERGRTFLLDTQRRKILHRFADDDPKNNPPWVQMYAGLWRPVPGVQGRGWAEYSTDRYTVPVIGTVSRDGKHLTAIANGSADSFCNAWHDCLHNNPKWLPADAPPAERRWRLKIYLMANDPEALLRRVAADFPEAAALEKARAIEE